MQKSRIKSVILTAALALSVMGCGLNVPNSAGQPPESSSTPVSEIETVESADRESAPQENTDPEGTGQEGNDSFEESTSDMLIKRDFGSYTVPKGWVEYEPFTTEQKVFYLVEGTEKDNPPDNISVEVGENPYSAEEHEKFRDAIMQQLMMQLKDAKAQLDGSGTYTEVGNIVYKFTITPEDGDLATTQYYIIGDQRFVLVHETAKIDSDADAAAESIVESFVWAEDKGTGGEDK